MSDKDRKLYIKCFNEEFVHCVSQFVRNLPEGNIPIKTSHSRCLSRHNGASKFNSETDVVCQAEADFITWWTTGLSDTIVHIGINSAFNKLCNTLSA
jgi:hypothetical protein